MVALQVDKLGMGHRTVIVGNFVISKCAKSVSLIS